MYIIHEDSFFHSFGDIMHSFWNLSIFFLAFSAITTIYLGLYRAFESIIEFVCILFGDLEIFNILKCFLDFSE